MEKKCKRGKKRRNTEGTLKNIGFNEKFNLYLINIQNRKKTKKIVISISEVSKMY